MKSDPLFCLPLSVIIGTGLIVVWGLSRETIEPSQRYSLDNWMREEFVSEVDESALWWITVALVVFSEVMCCIYCEHKKSNCLEERAPTRFPYMKYEDSPDDFTVNGQVKVNVGKYEMLEEEQVKALREFLHFRIPPTSYCVTVATEGFSLRQFHRSNHSETRVSYQFITKSIQVEWVRLGNTLQVISGYFLFFDEGNLEEQLDVLKLALETSRDSMDRVRNCKECSRKLSLISNSVFEVSNIFQYEFDCDDFLLVE